MSAKSFFQFLTLIIALSLSLSFTIFGQTPIPDENGHETDLVNMNPDPHGEPWIGGGLAPMTTEDSLYIENLPKLTIPQKYRGRALPGIVDHSKEKEFPPVFLQVGQSCAQASAVSYVFTWEFNVLKGITATRNNQFAYGYTYSFVNNGSNSGLTWMWEAWEILKKTGAPDVEDFYDSLHAGLSGTRWMDGYEKWHKINNNRVTEIFTIDVSTVEGVNTLKQWCYDHANGDAGGGIASFGASSMFGLPKTINSGPHKGEKVAPIRNASANHAMTFAGYSDSITYDVNGDGKITDDIDITSDGVVDLKDKETGALLVVNSYGTDWAWGFDGKIWVPVSTVPYIYTGTVWCIKVKEHTPKLEYKITMTAADRNNFSVYSGFSNDINASTPSDTFSYGYAFNPHNNRHSGNWPMEGREGSETLEFGLDVSDFYNQIINNEAKFFLAIRSNSNASAVVNSFSLIDYTKNPPKEYTCDESNVTINSGTTYLSIIFSGQTAIAAATPKTVQQQIKIINKSGVYSLYIPFEGKSTVAIMDLKGRQLADFETHSKNWHTIPAMVTNGVRIANIQTSHNNFVKKFKCVK